MNENLVYGPPALGRRIGAFIVDYVILLFFGLIPFFFCFDYLKDMSVLNMRVFFIYFSVVMAIAVGGILFKDVFGRSLGKLLFGVHIAHSDAADLPVTAGQRILRNVPLLFWPIELIMTFQDPYRMRLGDKWAHTVIAADTRKKAPVALLVTLGAIVFVLFILLITTTAIRNDDSYKTATDFIQSQEEIVSAVGGIEGFGFLPSGSLQYSNSSGIADLKITVIGKDARLTVEVLLTKKPGEEWVVTGYDY